MSTIYFASLMVRLILVLAPSLCILSGIGISELVHDLINGFFEKTKIVDKKVEDKN